MEWCKYVNKLNHFSAPNIAVDSDRTQKITTNIIIMFYLIIIEMYTNLKKPTTNEGNVIFKIIKKERGFFVKIFIRCRRFIDPITEYSYFIYRIGIIYDFIWSGFLVKKS